MVLLQVGNLPSNRLALTNRVYVSPSRLKALAGHASVNNMLLTVGNCPYRADAHPSVPDDTVALNGLHRRFLSLTLGARVEVSAFNPPPNIALSTLHIAVDLLAKRPSGTGAKVIDADRLATDFLNAYMEQVFQVDQILAMDFEGIKLELVVKDLQYVNLSSNKKNLKNASEIESTMGLLLNTTTINFSKASALVALTGKLNVHLESAAETSLFQKNFDFEALGIGGLNAEFNEIFRRAFASRIWPSHIIQQMGIAHVRGKNTTF